MAAGYQIGVHFSGFLLEKPMKAQVQLIAIDDAILSGIDPPQARLPSICVT
jgi:hypothetical protein